MKEQKDDIWHVTGIGTAVLTAFGLGSVFGFGVALYVATDTWLDLGIYMFMLALFHLWEWVYVAMFHPDELTFHSFLITHSNEYTIAAVASWCEYLIERWLFPSIKGTTVSIYVGFFLVLGGQLIRTLAMYTAGYNFHHHIREERDDKHKLVTSGIYEFLRHPSYFGWFWFSVGTQVVLGNPICLAGYAYASWSFFNERIRDEEETLLRFFGDDYKKYKARTPTGIPFIP